MSTLRLPPEEFRLVQQVAEALKAVDLGEVARQFTAEQIRDFLTSHTTVVGPGEVVLIRVSDLTPAQMVDYQRSFNEQHDCGAIPFRAFVVYGDEVAKVAPEPAAQVPLGTLDAHFAEQAGQNLRMQHNNPPRRPPEPIIHHVKPPDPL